MIGWLIFGVMSDLSTGKGRGKGEAEEEIEQ